ncbi:MAG: GH25 family lysozyme [Lactovum sp.]
MRKKLKLTSLLITLVLVGLASFLIIFIRSTEPPKPGEAYSSLPDIREELKTGDINLVEKPVIDLSAYQPVESIDYDLLSENISGAIIRVQDGIKAGETVTVNKDGSDPTFKYHITNLQAKGIPVSVYAFANITSIKNVKKEARAFYERAQEYQPTFWWVDVEIATMKDMNAGVEAYRAELEKLGAKNIGIYSTDGFLTTNKINTNKFDAVWLAYYGVEDKGFYSALQSSDRPFQIQQYTAVGMIAGYDGPVDLNRILTQQDYQKLFLSAK